MRVISKTRLRQFWEQPGHADAGRVRVPRATTAQAQAIQTGNDPTSPTKAEIEDGDRD
jgi:hypothetical protein